MYRLEIRGLASEKIFYLEWDYSQIEILNQSLLDFLTAQSLPIAYNCYGEGICRKCILIVNSKEVLSCQIFMKDLSDNAIIEISYL